MWPDRVLYTLIFQEATLQLYQPMMKRKEKVDPKKNIFFHTVGLTNYYIHNANHKTCNSESVQRNIQVSEDEVPDISKLKYKHIIAVRNIPNNLKDLLALQQSSTQTTYHQQYSQRSTNCSGSYTNRICSITIHYNSTEQQWHAYSPIVDQQFFKTQHWWLYWRLFITIKSYYLHVRLREKFPYFFCSATTWTQLRQSHNAILQTFYFFMFLCFSVCHE